LREGVLGKDLQGEWFNPRSGSRSRIPISASGTFQAADQQDWVLLLRKK
jgi:Putative collagen-binding domain of a collagenase